MHFRTVFIHQAGFFSNYPSDRRQRAEFSLPCSLRLFYSSTRDEFHAVEPYLRLYLLRNARSRPSSLSISREDSADSESWTSHTSYTDKRSRAEMSASHRANAANNEQPLSVSAVLIPVNADNRNNQRETLKFTSRRRRRGCGGLLSSRRASNFRRLLRRELTENKARSDFGKADVQVP